MFEFWRAWAFSVAIETSILSWFVGRNTRVVLTGIIASSLTLPWLWFVGAHYIRDNTRLMAVGEPIIFMVEMLIIRLTLSVDWRRAALISFVCNCTSFLLGLFLM